MFKVHSVVHSAVVQFKVEKFHLDLTYSKIAGKWWGPKGGQPMLMLHGWQDNAGSFDTLIPLLPQNFSYLAIDWPGHGFSTHLPEGCRYHAIDFVPILEEIRATMKWDRLTLIAHSMGAIASFFYARLYPDHVNAVIALDTLKMQNHLPDATEQIYTVRTKLFIELLKKLKNQSPAYTYDELVQRVYDGTKRSVNKDKAKYLIERGTKPAPNQPNKFYFTRDIRLKFMQPFLVEHKVALNMIKHIQTPYLFVRTDDRDFAEPEENIREAVKLFKLANKQFEILNVRGTHHAHLNEPHLMAKQIGEFIKKFVSPSKRRQILSPIQNVMLMNEEGRTQLCH